MPGRLFRTGGPSILDGSVLFPTQADFSFFLPCMQLVNPRSGGPPPNFFAMRKRFFCHFELPILFFPHF